MVTFKRILRSHICGPLDGQCTDPAAHFEGSAEEWGEIVDKARADWLAGKWGAHDLGKDRSGSNADNEES